ncbi:hypothetical protein N9D65_03920 [Schleiferiaceae bacterium]|nr:hypothetical protein [Schleiferiaceae bacterium]
MQLRGTSFLACCVLILGLPVKSTAQESPRFRGELGYLYAFHEDLGITKKDWLLVPGTWSDPANYNGQSQYAFTFRDTSWYYTFNHHLPFINTRYRLSTNSTNSFEIAFLQSITINSWRQLSFMWGAEFIYRPVDWMQLALQGGFISGYHAVTDLQNPTLLPIEGEEGGVLLGANATADLILSERWKVRLSYNPLVTGFGLAYDITKDQ